MKPCCTNILCPGAGAVGISGGLEFDSPLANLTSELPDQQVFVGLNFGYGRYSQPPIGSNFTANSCLGFCYSTLSQQDADDCAARNNLQCVIVSWGTPPGTQNNGGPSSGPPLIPAPPGQIPSLNLNLNQSCLALCPDGLGFSFTVSAGTFIAENQLLANQMAFSRACLLAVLDQICLSNLSNSSGNAGQSFSGTIQITGGLAPYSIATVSGGLPAGLFFTQSNPQTIVISGTPTQNGTFPFTLLVTDARGNFMQKSFSITVAGINWNLLSWNLSNDNAVNGASFTDLTAGNTVNMSAVGFGPFGSAVAQPVGTISYTGPSVTATLQITMAVNNGNAFTFTDFTVLYDPGGANQTLLSIIGAANGTFQFTIPNSPTAKTIQITTHAAAGLTASNSSSVLGTLS